MRRRPNNSSEVAHFAPHLAAPEYLEIAGKALHDFDDKTIVDIGGGAGLLDLYIQNNANPKKIIIVDPVFQEKSYREVVLRASAAFDMFASTEPTQLIESRKQLAINDATSKNLYDAMEHTNNPHQILTELALLEQQNQPLQHTVARIESIKQKEKHNAALFDTYLEGKYKGVAVNSSSGEKILGIKDVSQDVVFINHVLHKLPDTYFAVLQEADRILKPSGEVIIIEYAHRQDHGDFFRKLCDKAGVIVKEQGQSIGIILKKGEYVKLKPLPLAIP